MHIVCSYVSSNLQFQALKVIKMIADKGDCYANVKNDLFDTPLRLACMGGKLQIINALLSSFGGNCGLYDEDNIDHIPLITAFNLGNHSIASLIITEMYKRQDKSRNTPLHIACMTGNISLMQFIAKMNCDINAMNHDGDTALHIAVRKGHLELMKVLLELVSDTDVIHQCNKVGKNPLHVACEIGDPLLFVELLKWKSFSLAKHEYTLLHLACECGHTPIVDIMLLETDVDINAKNSDGCTALHVACETGNNKIALLLLGKECDINIRDKNGNTPLHLACQAGSFQVCEEMLKANCNINARNNDGDTPLFMACKYCHFDILQQLINETEIQINATNNAGDTLFHILCRSPYCTSTITRYALEITQIDPNMPNLAGETPIQLTSDPFTIHELIRYDANPMDVYTSQVQLGAKNPPQPIVKVFIVGNPSVGKSTLTAALQKELSRLVKVFVPAKKVSGVEQKTAGIIPHEFDSKSFGSVTLYDFAGHREFYSSHAALLQNSIESSSPIFLLLVDLRESYEQMKHDILYWLSFIENQCTTVSKKPHVIIVGSHADIVKSDKHEIEEKEKIIDHLRTLPHFTTVELLGFISMDCQYSQSSGMTKLRHYLKDSCKDLRIVDSIRFNVHCFLVYLFDEFKESRAIKLDEVLQSIHNHRKDVVDDNPLFFLPDSLQTLYDLCYELNDRGHILLLKDKCSPLNSWVVIDKELLLSEVTGNIFAPEGLRQYYNLASSTGVVPLTKLSRLFTNYNVSMLVGYLTHLEFCHKISDNELLQLIDEQHQTQKESNTETYYFFPALVRVEAPSSLWVHKPHHTYHCGWILKCSRLEQFFTSRFLEVLLLRLAFSFALIATPDTDVHVPILQRKCSIWKNGIFWGDNKGVEAIFEVLSNNKSAVVLMRCSNMQALKYFLQLRSDIIGKVLAAVSEFCAKVDVVEYFIDPTETKQYPITANTTYSIKEIASLIIKNSGKTLYAVSEVGESLSLETLLTFEPYAQLGQVMVAKIFGSNDASSKPIPDHELSKLAHALSSNEGALTFAKLFDERVTAPPSSGQFLQILKTWITTCEGTYFNLHQKLDHYSIFCKRNPGIDIK